MSKKEAKEAKAPKVENVKVSPFLNDTTFLVSAPFGAGGTGTTVYGTYGDNGEHSYYYYQDNGDLDKITLDKGSSRYTWLDDLIKDQVKNNAKYPSWFTRLFPGVAPKQKFGGNMNYTSYLEGGGAAPLNAAPLVSKEDIAEVITAALNGTGETKQKATEALQEMMQDASLAPLVEQVMSEMGISSLKCGGRVKKKQLGQKIQKARKAGCGCILKKVGGRLIEVNSCTGLPVHKNGGLVRKYQQAGKMSFNYNTDRWKPGYYYNTDGRNRWYGLNTADGKIYTYQTPGIERADLSYTTGQTVPYSSLSADILSKMKLIGLNDGFYVRDLGNGLYGGWNDNGQYRRYGKSSDGSYVWDNGKSNFVFRNGRWEDPNPALSPNMELQFSTLGDDKVLIHNGNAYYNNGRAKINGTMTNYDINSIAWTPEQKLAFWDAGFNLLAGKPTEVQSPTEVQRTPTETWRSTFGAGKSGKFGGLTYDEALARLLEMLNADWFDANLGTSGLTKRGDDGMWGQTSKREWDRYQAALAARQAAASTPLTNQLLLNVSSKDALSLSNDDFLRWMKLSMYNTNRNTALMYDGQRYDNELAYNQAMDDRIMQEMPSLQTVTDIMNVRGKRKRNKLYNDYLSLVDSLTDKYQQYQGPAALTEELLAATTFRNGGKFNYKNYLLQ